jgi:hypothetical protein
MYAKTKENLCMFTGLSPFDILQFCYSVLIVSKVRAGTYKENTGELNEVTLKVLFNKRIK